MDVGVMPGPLEEDSLPSICSPWAGTYLQPVRRSQAGCHAPPGCGRCSWL